MPVLFAAAGFLAGCTGLESSKGMTRVRGIAVGSLPRGAICQLTITWPAGERAEYWAKVNPRGEARFRVLLPPGQVHAGFQVLRPDKTPVDPPGAQAFHVEQ